MVLGIGIAAGRVLAEGQWLFGDDVGCVERKIRWAHGSPEAGRSGGEQ